MNRLVVLGISSATFCAQQIALAAPGTNTPPGFQLKPGFRLELVAAEPLVFDPVALAFDTDGRLFVAEDRDFPGPDTGAPHLGRVRLLEDADGDGRFDTSTDFIEDLPAPSALICWNNGVIVAAGTQILHCQDTNHDGRADVRRVLFAGPTNASALAEDPLPIRSFIWGLDNRIHAACSSAISGGAEPGVGFQLTGADFAFDARTREFEAESSAGSTGVSFDVRGRKFVCGPAHPLRQVMWESRHAASQQFFVLPPPLADLTGPASATPLLPLREVAAPRTSAAPPLAVRRVVDFFSAASSLLVYRGNAFPPAFSDDVFVADARANLIHRFKLRAVGAQLAAERPPDDRGTEFLATTNTWFRPMQLALGPDGALYLADLHREFVDPPALLQDSALGAAALQRGNDRGRIYRIVPDKFKQPPAPRLAQARLTDLAVNLAHLNGWHRDTAARLIVERNDPAAVPLLSNMVALAQSPLARLHALAVLDGLRALREAHVTRGLRDPDERVRQHAVRLAGKLAATSLAAADALWPALRTLAADPSASVRSELALALAGVLLPQRGAALLEIARRDPDDPWTRAAVLNALATGPGESLAPALEDARLRSSPGGQAFLGELALLIGTRNDAAEVAQAVSAVGRAPEGKLGCHLLRNLDEGLRRAGSALTTADRDNSLRVAYQRALVAASDDSFEPAARLEAIQALAALPFAEVGDGLFALVSPVQTEAVQLAAVRTLARLSDARVGTGLVQRWGGMSPRVRAAALDALLARAEGCDALLTGLQNGRLPRGALSSMQITFLRSHPDAVVSQRANGLFSLVATGNRPDALKAVLPALAVRGDAGRGRPLYLARCAACHRFRGEGCAFGPDLEGAANRGKEWVLTQLVDPNRRVPPEGVGQVVETRHLGSVLGVIENETPAGINLRQPFGERLAVPRVAIRSVTSLRQSAMPEGVEEGLGAQAVADLLAHLVPAVTP